ncbi:MAG: response regulator transcription factor [Propionibacteriaceae bacterium]|uniref:CheY-like superfamily n=1 Tax=Propionibacterium ruminifibrarum TaxID=1962131 RepID=A0A375I2B0_9ACTN|nr:response regulator transcription factor [Propionibacterium ruminifibrarum]MBE6477892.1 response regulator transcription factor [Propionibacteriaceae bacterium]SPF67366.1 CheY-like superfamily [Propionibacterium ruminifibrarum]
MNTTPTEPKHEPIRVVIADDQTLFRRAVSALIGREDDMTVIGEASNGLEVLETVGSTEPDVVILDLEMPVMNGARAAKLLRERHPDLKIVMLTVHDENELLTEAVRAGADGYLLKDLEPAELLQMIRGVMADQSPLSPKLVSGLLNQLRVGLDVQKVIVPEPDTAHGLSRRELEIMTLVSKGMSNREIATHLTITEGTVKNHVHNALRKLGMSNRSQAAAYIIRNGLNIRV